MSNNSFLRNAGSKVGTKFYINVMCYIVNIILKVYTVREERLLSEDHAPEDAIKVCLPLDDGYDIVRVGQRV